MFEYVHEHRVRYRESDPMGIVYHAHYLDYFEAARTEALREAGMAYKSLEDEGVIMPVIDAAITYRSPARYDDVLAIRTRLTLAETATRVRFDYDVFRKGESKVLVSGHVTLCFFDRRRNRPVRAPERLLRILSQLDSIQST